MSTGCLVPCLSHSSEHGLLDSDFLSSFPPIRLGGSLGYTIQTQRNGDSPREFRNRITGSANAASYIWQPWFTTVDGTLNLTRENVTGGTAESDSLVTTGSLSLNVLPLSNFPSTLTYLRNDSSVDGTLFTSQTTTDRVALRNRVFIPGPQLTIATNGAFEITSRDDAGEEEVVEAGMDVTKVFETSTLNVKLKHDQSTFDRTDGGEDNDRQNDLINVRHDYTPLDEVYVQSSSTASRTAESFESTERETFLLQGVTSGQWRPEKYPVTINGALRTLTQTLEIGNVDTPANDTTTETESVAGTLGMNYVFAPRLTSTVGLNANIQNISTEAAAESGETQASGTESQSANLSAGINYFSLDRDLAGFSWSWNSSALGQAGYASDADAARSLSAQLGHRATRGVDIPLLGLSTLSASQQGRTTHTAGAATVPGISHNASLTRSVSENRVRTYIRFSASDSRELAGTDPSTSQLFTAQLNRLSTIDTSSSWEASLSLQTSRQTFGDNDPGFVTTANGSAAYTKRDVFDVTDLRFRSQLIVNAAGFGRTVEDESLSERIDSQWNNEFLYRIGKIDMRLQARVFRNEGQLGDSVFFSILRRFD